MRLIHGAGLATPVICLLNKFMNNHDKIFCHKKFKGCMFICRNSEGVHGKRKVGNPCDRTSIVTHACHSRFFLNCVVFFKNFYSNILITAFDNILLKKQL